MAKRDFGHGAVMPLVLSLSLPTCLSQAVNVLYAIVDRMFIGNIQGYGDLALAGVGVAVPITSLISSFAVLVGMGGSPLMAIGEGHGEHDEAERILSTGFVMLLFFSLLLTPLCFILKIPLLRLFGSSEATFVYADEYLSWYLAGTPFALLSGGAMIRLRLRLPGVRIVIRTLSLGLSPFIVTTLPPKGEELPES